MSSDYKQEQLYDALIESMHWHGQQVMVGGVFYDSPKHLLSAYADEVRREAEHHIPEECTDSRCPICRCIAGYEARNYKAEAGPPSHVRTPIGDVPIPSEDIARIKALGRVEIRAAIGLVIEPWGDPEFHPQCLSDTCCEACDLAENVRAALDQPDWAPLAEYKATVEREAVAELRVAIEALYVEFERWERMDRNVHREGDPDMHAEEYHLGRADVMVDALAKLRAVLADDGAALREVKAGAFEEGATKTAEIAKAYDADLILPVNPYREGPGS